MSVANAEVVVWKGVLVNVNRNRRDVEFATGGDDTTGNLSSIGYQNATYTWLTFAVKR